MSLTTWSETIVIAELQDEPSLSEDLSALAARFEQDGDHRDVVLDLAEVNYLTSSNIAALLRLRRLVISNECRMKVTGCTNSVWGIFLTTGLDKVFDFVDDKLMALATLQMGG